MIRTLDDKALAQEAPEGIPKNLRYKLSQNRDEGKNLKENWRKRNTLP
jgi:hypothetical protein